MKRRGLVPILLVLLTTSLPAYLNAQDSLFHFLDSLANSDDRIQTLSSAAESYQETRPEHAMILADELLRRVKAHDLPATRWVASAHQTKGLVYQSQGKYGPALEHLYQALAIHEEIQDSLGLGSVHHHLGQLLAQHGNDSLALLHLSTALNYQLMTGDKEGMTATYLRMGIRYNDQGKEKQAYQFFGRALDLAIITDNIPDKAASFTQLGKIYLQRRDTVKAKQVFTHAISLYQQQKMKKEELDSRNYLAQCYIMSKQWEAAITELETCLILEEELQEPESLLDTYLAFAQVYEYLDDFAQALTYQRLHQEIKDTMLAQSQSQSVAAIEKIHELEDQKKEMVLVQKNESIQNLKRLGWLSTCSLILLVLFIILLVKRTRAQAFTNQLLVEKSREIEVTNQELSQSNRELKEFTHAVSHDLKQPLRTIGSFASLMVQRYHRQLDEEGDHYLNFITQGVQHMHLLLSDLQTYAYIGRANVEPAPVNLNHILEEVKANLHQQIEERGAVIKANPLPSLMGHQTSLYQLFQNLISNAIKFQIQGVTPKISIRVMDEENYLRVEVVDNGIGIPDAFKARIFRAFQRLHNQSDYPGTGIGLAICHKVMLQLGGKIDVQSELGKGSKFRLWFPKEVLVAHPKEQRPIKKEKNNLGILPIFPQKANLEAER